MKKRYEVIVSRRAEQMLTNHVCFLARASVKAARRLRDEFAETLDALEDNPFQFPPADDLELPGEYRKALFGKRYQAIFYIEGDVIYLDAVLDCRMDNTGIISKP